MNYTKEEWKINKTTATIHIQNKAGWTIASIHPWGQQNSKRGKDNEANANLIAAAPDMEGVLRQLVRYCEQWQQANGYFPNGDGRTIILKNAEEALAKAEGK